MQFFEMMFLAVMTIPSLALSTPTPSNDPTSGISTTLLSKLNFFSQYCSAICCDNNALNGTGTPIICPIGSCPSAKASSAFIFGNFYKIGSFSTGMVAIDPSHKTIVLVFRGTDIIGATSQNILDLISCLAICQSCHCHHGYYLTWTNVRGRVIALITAARKECPWYGLVITGHSLGATQALFVAAEFRTNGTAATLYTYGQPHVGDETFAGYVTKQRNNYRVTHTNDAAPQYESSSLGYRHISPEYWIYEDRNVNLTVERDQIRVAHGINSPKGNEGTDGRWLAAHFEYFQVQMASCFTTVEPGLEFPRHEAVVYHVSLS